VDRKTKKELNVLIDTGPTACYIKKGIFENKNELLIYKKSIHSSWVFNYEILSIYIYIYI